MESRTTLNEADRANRPEGTRPNLPTLVQVQGWPGANPPGTLIIPLCRKRKFKRVKNVSR